MRTPITGRIRPQDAAAETPVAWNTVESGAAVTINVTRAPEAARYAPEAVWFEAVPSGFDLAHKPSEAFAYRPDFHQIEYAWDFGEPGAVFTAPQNVPDAYRDANVAPGQITAHVFQTGGTKRVRCVARRVIDAETMEIEEAVAEVTLEVGAPEDIWTEFNTVVVAQDEDFTGAPPGARATTVENTEEVPWWSTPRHWLTQVNRLIGEGERAIRVLFKRGEFYRTALYKPNTRAPHIVSFMHFGAWGDPARLRPAFPRLGADRAGWTNGQPCVFQSVRALHDYNPVTETGTRSTLMNHSEAGYALFTDVGFWSAGTGVVMQSDKFAVTDTPTHVCFHDCDFENLAAYGIFASDRHGDKCAYLGCRDIDVGSAPHGGDNQHLTGNSQGPLRVTADGEWVILGADFFSRHGWTLGNHWPGTDIRATAEQPCIRVFGSGDISRTGNGRVVIARCTGEGPFMSAGSVPRAPAPRGNLLVEQVIGVSSPSNGDFLKSEAGALTIRNTYWIKPYVEGGFPLYTLFIFPVYDRAPDVPDDRAAHLAEPIHLYNNTFIVLDPTTLRGGTFAGIDTYLAYDEANNVLYAPNMQNEPRHEDIEPFETAPLWPLRWLGRLEEADNGILQTQYAPAANAAQLLRPLPGSPLVGTARDPLALLDLFGNERRTTQSRGALEPG